MAMQNHVRANSYLLKQAPKMSGFKAGCVLFPWQVDTANTDGSKKIVSSFRNNFVGELAL